MMPRVEISNAALIHLLEEAARQTNTDTSLQGLTSMSEKLAASTTQGDGSIDTEQMGKYWRERYKKAETNPEDTISLDAKAHFEKLLAFLGYDDWQGYESKHKLDIDDTRKQKRAASTGHSGGNIQANDSGAVITGNVNVQGKYISSRDMNISISNTREED